MALNCGAHRYKDTGERFYKAVCPDCLALNENVEYSRALQVVVYVDREWLTAGFEYDEQSGWNEMEKQLSRGLPALRLGQTARVEFDSWAEEPVVEK